MYLVQLVTNFIIYMCGVTGILYNNNKSIIFILMCIELILLSINMNFLILSSYLDDSSGQILSLLILTVAGAESAIGLAILIIYFRKKGDISLHTAITVKG